jgi:hypothetical protein
MKEKVTRAAYRDPSAAHKRAYRFRMAGAYQVTIEPVDTGAGRRYVVTARTRDSIPSYGLRPRCSVCGRDFIALSGGATGCVVHGIRAPA